MTRYIYQCEYCGADSDQHDYEHLARECFPKQIEKLTLENWQLKGALGYPVPADIPEGPFKCGLCDARRREAESTTQ